MKSEKKVEKGTDKKSGKRKNTKQKKMELLRT